MNTRFRKNVLATSSYASRKSNVGSDPAPFLIRPTFAPRGVNPAEFSSYLFFIEQIIRRLIPKDLLTALLGEKSGPEVKEEIGKLNALIPIVAWSHPERARCTLTATFLCPSAFTSGVGRYLSDTLCRWLIPGKFLNISSSQALNFQFISYPEHNYFLQQIMLDIEDENELMIIKKTQESLTKEIRLNILAVKHARHVVATKKLSSEQKQVIIQENIASVLERPSKAIEQNAFDQMQHFFLQLSAEEKITQIKDRFTPFLEHRPKVFDRDIFNEIKSFVPLFRDQFTALRDLRHVARLISFQYFFRKQLQNKALRSPQERHLSLKLLKTHLSQPSGQEGKKTVLGILGGINVFRESELFEERHIFEAVQHCLPNIRKVEDSFILDRRSHNPVRIFYIEVEKKDRSPFTLSELKEFQRCLLHELKQNIETVIHPVFMPRNEEEIMRNIVILSQQLKYVHDIPQVIISYDMQTEKELCFTVILLRLLMKQDEPSIPVLFQRARAEFKLEALEVKKVGMLRKKYAKEVNVFTIKLDKRPFLRNDYTLDIFKARQSLSSELNRVLEGMRDFNGGILSKQQEVFQELRDSLAAATSHEDLLLENYFYSLTPPLRQTLLLPSILKQLYMMLLESLEENYQKKGFFLKRSSGESPLLLMAASPYPGFKEKVISAVTSLQIPSSQLSFTQLNAYGIHCIGYIYQSHEPNQCALFFETVEEALDKHDGWN